MILGDSCANFPCKNGGGCANLYTDTGTGWSAYRCTCPSGFYGQNCDTRRRHNDDYSFVLNMNFALAINSCSTLVCPTYKICNEQPTGPVCTCTGSKVGTFCQYGKQKIIIINEREICDIGNLQILLKNRFLFCYLDNPCSLSSSNYCLNGGTCVSTNTDPPIASCLCQQGFTGLYCDATIQNNPCTSNPCQTRGYCALSAGNTSYSCICESNYTGSQCERGKNQHD